MTTNKTVFFPSVLAFSFFFWFSVCAALCLCLGNMSVPLYLSVCLLCLSDYLLVSLHLLVCLSVFFPTSLLVALSAVFAMSLPLPSRLVVCMLAS